MIMSAHQPAYLPWLGYIDKIKRSDIFIFLDTVQYEKNSFTNRNRIKTANGPIWLSVPVIKTNHFEKMMSEMLIDKNYHWRKKHLNAIFLAYKKASNFDRLYPDLERLYAQEYDNIVDLTWEHLHFWLKLLGIHTKIIKSSSLEVFSKKSDMVFDLCKKVHADYYISGALGRGYLNVDKFTSAGIKVEFQDYKHPIYPQLYGAFIPNMGIVDFAMNVYGIGLSPKAISKCIESGIGDEKHYKATDVLPGGGITEVFQGESFDFILVSECIYYFTDRERKSLLDQFYRSMSDLRILYVSTRTYDFSIYRVYREYKKDENGMVKVKTSSSIQWELSTNLPKDKRRRGTGKFFWLYRGGRIIPLVLCVYQMRYKT